MKLKGKIARAALFVLLCLLSAFGAAWRYNMTRAQEYPTSMVELRADSLVHQGEELVVDVYANLAAPAYGFGLQINYDPTQLELQPQEDNSGVDVPLRVGGVFSGAQRIRNVQETVDGSAMIDAVYTLLPPADAAIGESFIGRLSFIVLQEAPLEIHLQNPRLIALDGATAVDLPVESSEVLALAPGMPVQETVVDATGPTTAGEIALAPETQIAQPAPVALADVQAAPALDDVVATINTPNDALAAMNRTNSLMNAVLIGLLTIITILLGVISVSSVLDAIMTARMPQPALAYAYVQRPTPQPARVAPPQRPRRATPHPVVIAEMEPTIPNRSVLLTQSGLNRKSDYR